ncbi:MAG TPA: glycoside hydrolase family 88 protein [Anaerolineaceae bacterium]
MYQIPFTSKNAEDAFKAALVKVDANLVPFREKFPDDTTYKNVYYPRKDRNGEMTGANIGWTTSFWTGILWLAYEWTKDEKYREVAQVQVDNFITRMETASDVDHHDLGFLYSITCIADYKLNGSQKSRDGAILAAETLMKRFWEKPGIIQAWGRMDDPKQRGRAIIDSLMNLPLLYWASLETGNPRYAVAALRHATQLQRYQVRPDATTYHTFYFNTETGEADHGETAQGFADDSCWARGQAWAMYGFPLSYIYTRRESFLKTATALTDYFLAHTPSDRVAYWDLAFGDGSGEEKDSSASAIAVCGMLELAKYLPAQKAASYRQQALEILKSLVDNYSTRDHPESNALLLHSVYSKPGKHGVDEACLWGDYFYMEALMRVMNPSWRLYW